MTTPEVLYMAVVTCVALSVISLATGSWKGAKFFGFLAVLAWAALVFAPLPA